MDANAARTKVFQTPELFEAILECLPIRTIFIIQRVSAGFRDTVTYSLRIQQKLFLRTAVTADTSSIWTLLRRSPKNSHYFETEEEAWSEHVFTPISTLDPPPPTPSPDPNDPWNCLNYPLEDLHLDKDHFIARDKDYFPALLCPLASRVAMELTPDKSPNLAEWTKDGATRAAFERILFEIPRIDTICNSPSWRAMYLTDPPCKAVLIYAAWVGTVPLPLYQLPPNYMVVRNATGIRLGDLLDHFQQQCTAGGSEGLYKFQQDRRQKPRRARYASLADFVADAKRAAGEEGTGDVPAISWMLQPFAPIFGSGHTMVLPYADELIAISRKTSPLEEVATSRRKGEEEPRSMTFLGLEVARDPCPIVNLEHDERFGTAFYRPG